MQRLCALWVVTFVLCACGGGTPAVDGGAVADAGGDASDASTGRDADQGGAALRPEYPLAARFPEGGAYDPLTRTFYVGSLADGSVRAVDGASGEERVLFTESAEGTWWTLGMDVDVARRQLWVCAMDDRRDEGDDDHPYDGYVWVFDLESGERVARHALADAFPTATCTDVVVAADGTAYVCDREHPNLYRIDGGGVSMFVTDDALSGAIVGQNGLVVLPDQSALLSIVYLPSRLVHVRLDDASITEVDIDGDFFDGLPLLSGADGIALSGGAALVMFTSQLVRVTPSVADWRQATAVSIDVPAGMTDVIHTEDGDYLLNGQALAFLLGDDPDPFELVRFEGSF